MLQQQTLLLLARRKISIDSGGRWVPSSTVFSSKCEQCRVAIRVSCCNPVAHVVYFRVLKEVDFERKFEELPKFNPDMAASVDVGTPLPSPRDIVNSYRKKRKQSVGQLCGNC